MTYPPDVGATQTGSEAGISLMSDRSPPDRLNAATWPVLEALIGQIYESALDPALWDDTLTRITSALSPLEWDLAFLIWERNAPPGARFVGDPERCKQACDLLLKEHGIYIQPISYPTVAKGTERLRITPSPFHDHALIGKLATSLRCVWDSLEL